MTDPRIESVGLRVRQLRRKRDLLGLDLRREVKWLHRNGLSERQIAALVKMAEPTIHTLLEVGERDLEPLDGFAGATPMEICKRYEAGELDRQELIDQLVRFPYAPHGTTDGYDSLLVNPPGTWSELSLATQMGIVDHDVYEEVFNRRHGL
ncbi:MAG: hypothetical protein Q4G21_09700 [Dermabacter sp.]|nr:hypothetical protein [Dermabacter sp.]